MRFTVPASLSAGTRFTGFRAVPISIVEPAIFQINIVAEVFRGINLSGEDPVKTRHFSGRRRCNAQNVTAPDRDLPQPADANVCHHGIGITLRGFNEFALSVERLTHILLQTGRIFLTYFGDRR